MKIRSLAYLAAAFGLAMANPVHAATASSTISGLTIKLIDLAPDDGIDPEVTFTTGRTSWMTIRVQQKLCPGRAIRGSAIFY